MNDQLNNISKSLTRQNDTNEEINPGWLDKLSPIQLNYYALVRLVC